MLEVSKKKKFLKSQKKIYCPSLGKVNQGTKGKNFRRKGERKNFSFSCS